MLSDAIEALKQELEQADGGRLLPATEGDLEEAGRFGFPDVLLDFYRQNAPDVADGRVELWRSRPASGQRIGPSRTPSEKTGITCRAPSFFPLGYVVFASNMFGDAYCV